MTLGVLGPLGCFLGFNMGCSANRGNALEGIASELNRGIATHPNHPGVAGLFPKINIIFHQDPDQYRFHPNGSMGQPNYYGQTGAGIFGQRRRGLLMGQHPYDGVDAGIFGQPQYGLLMGRRQHVSPDTGFVEPQKHGLMVGRSQHGESNSHSFEPPKHDRTMDQQHLREETDTGLVHQPERESLTARRHDSVTNGDIYQESAPRSQHVESSHFVEPPKHDRTTNLQHPRDVADTSLFHQPERESLTTRRHDDVTLLTPDGGSKTIPRGGLKDFLESYKMGNVDKNHLPGLVEFIDDALTTKADDLIKKHMDILKEAKKGFPQEEVAEAANLVYKQGIEMLSNVPWYDKNNSFIPLLNASLRKQFEEVLGISADK